MIFWQLPLGFQAVVSAALLSTAVKLLVLLTVLPMLDPLDPHVLTSKKLPIG